MKKTLAILVVSPVLCSYVWAGPVQQRLPDTPYLDGGQVRTSGEELKFGAVRGMGQDVPLFKALTAIIPRGYTVRTVGVERWLLDEPISWAGGRSWTEVLADALTPYPELVVDIATGSKVVILRQQYSSSDGSPERVAMAAIPAPEAGNTPKTAKVELPAASSTGKRAQTAQAPAAEKPRKLDVAKYMDMPRTAPRVDPLVLQHVPTPVPAPTAPALPASATERAMAEKLQKLEAALAAYASSASSASSAQPKTELSSGEKPLKAELAVAEKPLKADIVLAHAPAAHAKPEAAVYEKPIKPEAAARTEAARPEPKEEFIIVEKTASPAAAVVTAAAKPASKREHIIERKSKATRALATEAPKAAPAAEAPKAKPVAEPAPLKEAVIPPPSWEVAIDDQTLKSAMTRWTESAGWQLSWELTVDYPVDARASISGSFQEAVEAVVKSMERAEVPMKAIFYKGNKVLRIVAKGVE